jgi:hypothetical protein
MKEQELFEKVKAELSPDLEKAEDEFSSWDCITHSDAAYIELKCRNRHYDDLLIEKSKYDRLVMAAQYFNYNPVYINSTPEGAWAFNLNYVQPEWEDRDGLPATTEFDNNEKVTKTVGYLNINRGVQLW